MLSKVFAFASLLVAARAQQVGTLTTETHPRLSVSKCTSSGCTVSQQTVVLDANWRWLHSTSGATNCYTGNTWDKTLCPDNVSCAANCALDGADYSGTYGITTSGNSLRLNFVTKGSGTNVGSRTYLMAAGDQKYESFNLLAAEFTFTVDVSKLPCGLNGALYFSQMEADGGLAANPGNKAGAKYGTGYCDAQCPRDLKFINGKANAEGWGGDTNSANSGKGLRGSCCNEMDIWEANSISSAFTPHPCDNMGIDECTGLTCGVGDRYASKCDADGCDINTYRMGNLNFYGPGSSFTIDTTKPITVITQFLTNTGTNSGTLVEIKRFWGQGGKVWATPSSKIAGVPGNTITDEFCANQKTVFGDPNTTGAKGGLAQQGEALKNSVLVMSIWDDYSVNMLWLDSQFPLEADPSAPGVSRGTCSRDSGKPADVEANSPNAYVAFSDIKWGPINSTFAWQNVINPDDGTVTPPVSTTRGPVTSTTTRTTTRAPTTTPVVPTTTRTTTRGVVTTTTRTTTTTTTRTTSASGGSGTSPKWGQCGGNGWTGPTACAAGSTCTFSNPWYSQCL